MGKKFATGCALLLSASMPVFAERALDALEPDDAANEQLMEARTLAAKALGEDARDLVFVPVTPCTVWDTRFASGAPFGPAIGNGDTRRFYSHLDGAGGNFTVFGGNAACAEANHDFIGGRPYAVMMTVYVNNPSGNGWLTFYRDGDPDPSQATISVYYSPGPTRTQTVITKSSRGYGSGTHDVAVTGRFSTAHASASVVGYFIKPQATGLECQTIDTAGPNVAWNAGTLARVTANGCPPTYLQTGLTCSYRYPTVAVYLKGTDFAGCHFYNGDTYTLTSADITVKSRCCRVPGR